MPPAKAERVVVEGKLVADAPPEAVEDGTIRIKGKVSEDESECTLMVSQNLLEGFSWYFGSEADAAGSVLAEKLMALPHVHSVLVDESTITDLTAPHLGRMGADCEGCGAAIRQALQGEFNVVSDAIRDRPPEEDRGRKSSTFWIRR